MRVIKKLLKVGYNRPNFCSTCRIHYPVSRDISRRGGVYVCVVCLLYYIEGSLSYAYLVAAPVELLRVLVAGFLLSSSASDALRAPKGAPKESSQRKRGVPLLANSHHICALVGGYTNLCNVE